MSNKVPLANYSGDTKEIQSGDIIDSSVLPQSSNYPTDMEVQAQRADMTGRAEMQYTIPVGTRIYMSRNFV